MVENQIIVLFSAIVFSAMLGGFIGWLFALRDIVRVSNERDELRGLISAADVDFGDIEAVSKKLAGDAAVISEAAAKMIAMAQTAERKSPTAA